MPGIHGPLVDEEGFPRADIDVHAVREARHRLACLKTDYRTVQGRLEELVLRVHAKCTEFEAVTQQLSLPHEQPRSRDVPGELKDAPPPLHESKTGHIHATMMLPLESNFAGKTTSLCCCGEGRVQVLWILAS